MALVEAADARPEEAPDLAPTRARPAVRASAGRSPCTAATPARAGGHGGTPNSSEATRPPGRTTRASSRIVAARIVDVAQQVGERERVEALVGERQRLGLALRSARRGERSAAAKRARAAASISALWSMPTTEQSARASSSAATIPVPVATSSTRSPAARRHGASTSARRQRGSCQKLSAAESAS